MSAVDNTAGKKRVGFWAKIFASQFLFVSIVVHVLFGVGATYFIVQRVQAKRKLAFRGGPPSPNASTALSNTKFRWRRRRNRAARRLRRSES